jgi:hypothetical protein
MSAAFLFYDTWCAWLGELECVALILPVAAPKERETPPVATLSLRNRAPPSSGARFPFSFGVSSHVHFGHFTFNSDLYRTGH